MTHRLNLEGAKVVVTGNADGHPVTLEGNIKNVSIKAEHDDTDYYGVRYRLQSNTRYFFEFDTNNEQGVAYTVQVPTTTVHRTAQIEAPDTTVEALEKARKQVGAPNNARFRFADFMRNPATELVLDGPRKVLVEFYWTEKVPQKLGG